MAYIYQKATAINPDNCLILEPREQFIYPIPFKNWKQLRLGIWYSWVRVESDNVNCSTLGNEYTAYTSLDTPREKFYVGLKKTANTTFPMDGSEYFWGFRTLYQSYFDANTHNQLRIGFFYPGNYTNVNSSDLNWDYRRTTADATNNYMNWYVFDFAVTDRLATNLLTYAWTRTITMRGSSTGWGYTPPYSMRDSTINNTAWDVALSDVGTAGEIPGAVFIYSPYLWYKMRIHGVIVVPLR